MMLCKAVYSLIPLPIATSDPVGHFQPDLTGIKSSKTQFLKDLREKKAANKEQ